MLTRRTFIAGAPLMGNPRQSHQVAATVMSIQEVEDPLSGAVKVLVRAEFGPNLAGTFLQGAFEVELDPSHASGLAYGDQIQLTVSM